MMITAYGERGHKVMGFWKLRKSEYSQNCEKTLEKPF